MSSPITLSGFNSIDFSMILNAVMAQASQPITVMQTQQSNLALENSAYGLLATKLGSLETAAAGLSTSGAVTQYSSTLSATGSIEVSASGTSVPGTYDVKVVSLAKAQVVASDATAGDADTASVGDSGTLTIHDANGVQYVVQVNAPTTLTALANQINATVGDDVGHTAIPVTASVVQSAPGEYRLVLTAKNTGELNGFSVTGSLTGGVGTSFTQPTAQAAMDGEVWINGVKITSSTNTLTSAIPGATLTLLQANPLTDPDKTISVSVKEDDSSLTKNVQTFVSAYNGLVTFIAAQSTAAANGTSGTLAHESILRMARSALREALFGTYGSETFSSLVGVGIGFNQTGQLTLDNEVWSDALKQDHASVVSLFTGTSTKADGFTNGAFGSVQSALDEFTRAGGFVASAQKQLTEQGSRLDSQIFDMQSRLAIQRAALQREYTAADQAMTQLKSQSGTLSNMSTIQN